MDLRRRRFFTNMCAPGFIRTTGALVYTEVPAAASFACGVFELPQGNRASGNGRRSSAADTIARPIEVARVERITLSAASARTPGRQGVRRRALLAAKSSGYVGNALQTGAARGLVRATACPRSS